MISSQELKNPLLHNPFFRIVGRYDRWFVALGLDNGLIGRFPMTPSAGRYGHLLALAPRTFWINHGCVSSGHGRYAKVDLATAYAGVIALAELAPRFTLATLAALEAVHGDLDRLKTARRGPNPWPWDKSRLIGGSDSVS